MRVRSSAIKKLNKKIFQIMETLSYAVTCPLGTKREPTVHHLPCTIAYDGPAQVGSFFRVSSYVPAHLRAVKSSAAGGSKVSMDAFVAARLTGVPASAAAGTPTAAGDSPTAASSSSSASSSDSSSSSSAETKTASPLVSKADAATAGMLSATFRGRELTGVALPLPAGAQGLVLKEVFGRAPRRIAAAAAAVSASALAAAPRGGSGGFDDGFDGGFDDGMDDGFDDGSSGAGGDPGFDASFDGGVDAGSSVGGDGGGAAAAAVAATERTLEAIARFDTVTDWVREAIPSATDHTSRCLKWIEVARAMHAE